MSLQSMCTPDPFEVRQLLEEERIDVAVSVNQTEPWGDRQRAGDVQ